MDRLLTGPEFRWAREQLDVDLRDVSDEAELAPSTVSRWEREIENVAPDTVQRITDALARVLVREEVARMELGAELIETGRALMQPIHTTGEDE